MTFCVVLWNCAGNSFIFNELPRHYQQWMEQAPGDWRCVFEERAAIMEYHGELPRELAEAKALEETVRIMEEEKS